MSSSALPLLFQNLITSLTLSDKDKAGLKGLVEAVLTQGVPPEALVAHAHTLQDILAQIVGTLASTVVAYATVAGNATLRYVTWVLGVGLPWLPPGLEVLSSCIARALCT